MIRVLCFLLSHGLVASFLISMLSPRHAPRHPYEGPMTRASYKECNIDPDQRQECGYPGINEEKCSSRECCWSSEKGYPSCYHSVSTTAKWCQVDVDRKVQCGSSDIRKEQCLAKECCWQPSNVGPWCYEAEMLPIYTGQCGQTVIAPQTNNWRVIGGEEAIPNSWPFIVSLQVDGEHFCGGSILNNQWILSAAHCMDGLVSNSPNHLVMFGAHNISTQESTTSSVMIEEMIPHEDYSSEYFTSGFSVQHDFLLIKLARPVEFNDFISPVCLSQSQPAPGTSCYSMGWGIDSITDYSYTTPDALQQFLSPVIDSTLCNSTDWYNGRIHPSAMCAGWEEGGRGNCFGDSGGPLVCWEDDSWHQVGVVSWGEPCALARFPTVYANVPAYYDWVQKTLTKYAQ